jgi:hypothetical protein
VPLVIVTRPAVSIEHTPAVAVTETAKFDVAEATTEKLVLNTALAGAPVNVIVWTAFVALIVCGVAAAPK